MAAAFTDPEVHEEDSDSECLSDNQPMFEHQHQRYSELNDMTRRSSKTWVVGMIPQYKKTLLADIKKNQYLQASSLRSIVIKIVHIPQKTWRRKAIPPNIIRSLASQSVVWKWRRKDWASTIVLLLFMDIESNHLFTCVLGLRWSFSPNLGDHHHTIQHQHQGQQQQQQHIMQLWQFKRRSHSHGLQIRIISWGLAARSLQGRWAGGWIRPRRAWSKWGLGLLRA